MVPTLAMCESTEGLNGSRMDLGSQCKFECCPACLLLCQGADVGIASQTCSNSVSVVSDSGWLYGLGDRDLAVSGVDNGCIGAPVSC